MRMIRYTRSQGPRSFALAAALALAALAVSLRGCGPPGQRLEDPAPGSREQLALGLPLGAHLSSAVIPDSRYGDSSTTIEEALTYLKATQKDGVLHDRSGNEIHFETALIRKSGVAKTYPASAIVIKVAD
jgi:hypothetical protein